MGGGGSRRWLEGLWTKPKAKASSNLRENHVSDLGVLGFKRFGTWLFHLKAKLTIPPLLNYQFPTENREGRCGQNQLRIKVSTNSRESWSEHTYFKKIEYLIASLAILHLYWTRMGKAKLTCVCVFQPNNCLGKDQSLRHPCVHRSNFHTPRMRNQQLTCHSISHLWCCLSL